MFGLSATDFLGPTERTLAIAGAGLVACGGGVLVGGGGAQVGGGDLDFTGAEVGVGGRGLDVGRIGAKVTFGSCVGDARDGTVGTGFGGVVTVGLKVVADDAVVVDVRLGLTCVGGGIGSGVEVAKVSTS